MVLKEDTFDQLKPGLSSYADKPEEAAQVAEAPPRQGAGCGAQGAAGEPWQGCLLGFRGLDYPVQGMLPGREKHGLEF